jgi:hypothetical protein
MPINPSLEQGAFVPEATAAMGQAFEGACKELHDVGGLPMVRKVVAQRIIAAARGGELDPVRLRTAALSWHRCPNVIRSVSADGITSSKQPRQPQHP